MAAAGDSAYEGEFREIVYRHVEMIKEVIPAGAGQVALQRQIGELLNELKDIFQGIYLIRDLSRKHRIPLSAMANVFRPSSLPN